MPLDKGPGHSGVVMDVHRDLSAVALVMVSVVWCMYHQCRLIGKAVVVVMEALS